MRKKEIIGSLALLILVSGAPGCSYSFRQVVPPANEDLSGIRTVAVAPFTNLAQTENAGQIVTDLLGRTLAARGKYQVIDHESVLKVIPRDTSAIDRIQAQKIGQALNANAVLYGTVSEYWYQEDRKYSPYPEREPAVGLNARLVDVKSGAVIGAASVSLTGGGVFTYLFSDTSKQLHRVAQDASTEVIDQLLP